MDPLAARANAATAHRTGVSFTSLGTEVEEPLFLDEAEGHAPPPRDADRPSPFDLFADESDPTLAAAQAPAPAGVATPPAPAASARPAPTARPTPAARPLPVARAIAPPRPRPVAVKPTVAATPELFKTYSSSTPGTVSIVGLFVLIAATTMFVTVQACQVRSGLRTAAVTQPGP